MMNDILIFDEYIPPISIHQSKYFFFPIYIHPSIPTQGSRRRRRRTTSRPDLTSSDPEIEKKKNISFPHPIPCPSFPPCIHLERQTYARLKPCRAVPCQIFKFKTPPNPQPPLLPPHLRRTLPLQTRLSLIRIRTPLPFFSFAFPFRMTMSMSTLIPMLLALPLPSTHWSRSVVRLVITTAIVAITAAFVAAFVDWAGGVVYTAD
jgi:hypothetical protein